jgi:DNA-binding NtrC family response regulator
VNSVLIVDDESGIRQVLVRYLTPGGYDLREADSADAALAALAERTADVVLCDVQMPGHDGLWLMARISERYPAVAMILATADDTVPPTVSLRPAVIEYLVKPFSAGRVLAAVERAMKWRAGAATRAAASPATGLDEWLNSGDE